MGLPELGKEIVALVRPVWEPLRDFLYPPRCVACGGEVQSLPWCDTCAKRFLPYSDPLCAVCFKWKTGLCVQCNRPTLTLFVGYEYRPPLREIVLALKFHSVTEPVELLVESVLKAHLSALIAMRAELIVPVPLAEGRAYHRGYNQAELIANVLARSLQVPVEPTLLYRTRTRRPQSKVTRAEREKNVAGVFHVNEEVEQERPRARVLLVDDVVTTGATCREATRVLETAGYTVVGWMAIAHG